MFGMTGGSGALGMGVVLSLVDDFSQTSDKAMEKFSQLEGVTDEMATKITGHFMRLKQGLVVTGIGLAILAPMAMAVDKAAEISDQMADVRKTTGMATQEVINFRNELQDIDTRTSTADLLDIAKIGGQLGVVKEEMFGFTRAIDQANVALGDEFSGGAEEITKALGTLKDLFAETKAMKYEDALMKIGSAINTLGAMGKATGPNISNFSQRIGQLGALAPNIRETLAMGATLEEVGINGEIAAGGLTALITEATELTAHHDRMQQFADQMNMTREAATALFNSSRTDFMLKFAKSFQGMLPADIGTKLKQLGVGGIEAQKVIGSLSQNTDIYAKRLTAVNEQMGNATSLTDEFNIKNMTLGATLDKMGKAWDDMAVAIGEGAAPVFVKIYEAFKFVMDLFRRFFQTDAGKFVAQLLAVVGVVITLAGLFVTIKAAIGILIPMVTALGASMWAALAPVLPVVLPIVAGIMLLWKAWSSFKNVLEGTEPVASGFMGFLQRIGGMLYTAVQVFQSWNGQFYELDENLVNTLQKLGIFQDALNFATWIVRIKEFFSGFIDGMYEVWNVFSAVFGAIVDVVNAVFDVLGIKMDKNRSDMEKWKTAGKILAYIIGTVLLVAVISMTVALWNMAVAVVAATWPVLLLIGVIAALGYAIYKVGEFLIWLGGLAVDAGAYLYHAIVDNFDMILEKGKELFLFFALLPLNIARGIIKLVESVFTDGIMATWDKMKAWLSDKLSFMGSLNPFAGEADSGSVGTIRPPSTTSPDSFRDGFAQNEAARAGAGSPVVFDKSTVRTENIRIVANLDGTPIYDNMMDRQKIEDAREGTW